MPDHEPLNKRLNPYAYGEKLADKPERSMQDEQRGRAALAAIRAKLEAMP